MATYMPIDYMFRKASRRQARMPRFRNQKMEAILGAVRNPKGQTLFQPLALKATLRKSGR